MTPSVKTLMTTRGWSNYSRAGKNRVEERLTGEGAVSQMVVASY